MTTPLDPNRSEDCDPKVEKRSKEHIACKSLDDLFKLLVKCPSDVCCNKQVHCPVCSHVKPGKLNRIKTHIESTHWKNRYLYKEVYLLRCYDVCRSKPHFHCPEDGCVKMIGNRKDFKQHLDKHGSETTTATIEKSVCAECGTTVLTKNLNRHQKSHTYTQDAGFQASCVDTTNGLFLVTKTKRGRQDPIHVQNKTWGLQHQIQCPDKNCKDAKKIAIEGGKYGWTCNHVKATQNCHVGMEESNLTEASLTEAVNRKIINDSVSKEILLEKRRSEDIKVPLIIPSRLKQNTSVRYKYFSVLSKTKHHWSPLGRVVTKIDMDTMNVHYDCCRLKFRCIHKSITKWWMFKHLPHENSPDFAENQPENENMCDSSCFTEVAENAGTYPPKGDRLRELVRYLIQNKKQPTQLQDDVVFIKDENLKKAYSPKETECSKCGDHLNNEHIITKKGVILTINGPIHDVEMYYRCCESCGAVYRYQEFNEGVFNYNDKLLLSQRLCVHLRSGLQIKDVFNVEANQREPIVTVDNVTLTREDIQTLRPARNVECRIINACFSSIVQIASAKGKNVGCIDGYVIPTWLRNKEEAPILEDILPGFQDLQKILIPVYRPGHWSVAVIDIEQRTVWLLDPLYFRLETDCSAESELLRSIIRLNFSTYESDSEQQGWTFKTGRDECETLPAQYYGSDCGVFIIMYALYKALDVEYDFTVHDMTRIRIWLVLVLLESQTITRTEEIPAQLDMSPASPPQCDMPLASSPQCDVDNEMPTQFDIPPALSPQCDFGQEVPTQYDIPPALSPQSAQQLSPSKAYELRERKKQKRSSSWIYPSLVKRQRNKPYMQKDVHIDEQMQELRTTIRTLRETRQAKNKNTLEKTRKPVVETSPDELDDQSSQEHDSNSSRTNSNFSRSNSNSSRRNSHSSRSNSNSSRRNSHSSRSNSNSSRSKSNSARSNSNSSRSNSNYSRSNSNSSRSNSNSSRSNSNSSRSNSNSSRSNSNSSRSNSNSSRSNSNSSRSNSNSSRKNSNSSRSNDNVEDNMSDDFVDDSIPARNHDDVEGISDLVDQLSDENDSNTSSGNDESDGETDCPIGMDYCTENLVSLKADALGVMMCNKTTRTCLVTEHIFHHTFMEDPSDKENRKKYCYGRGQITEKASEWLLTNVTPLSHMERHPTHIYTLWRRTIKGLQPNCKLDLLFHERKDCATRYVLSVIYKYIICKMVAKYHNIQFIEANDLCSSKEIVHKPPKRNQSENIF